ncbi:MAG: molecular chaperone (small heat shock protein) [Bacteroidota bacterium]|jgi:HSP20 family protein|nr:molecular chaperone (small heat shock protein) [Bacteroidota bacterium]
MIKKLIINHFKKGGNMTLIKWNPSMGKEKQTQTAPSLDSYFGSFFKNELFPKDYAGYMPSVNITESKDSYGIEVSAPGFEKKDFNLSISENVLTISGEKTAESVSEEKTYVRKEFNYGTFKRSFNLADLVDEDHIDAKYENGILKIELPKNDRAKSKNVKHIQIG